MIQKNILIPKTARYFILGDTNSEKIEQIWIVCHGYGQLANYFIKKFEVLDTGKNLIIAPEALHRFYGNGFNGRVGASWMTKVDREEEILDYINYLDIVLNEVLLPYKGKSIKINVLGFSQSTATVCRWLCNKKPAINKLILWAGFLPHDLDLEKEREYLNNIKPNILVGKEDEFYDLEAIEKHKKTLKDSDISFEFTYFDGKHEIPREVLSKLIDSFQEENQVAIEKI